MLCSSSVFAPYTCDCIRLHRAENSYTRRRSSPSPSVGAPAKSVKQHKDEAARRTTGQGRKEEDANGLLALAYSGASLRTCEGLGRRESAVVSFKSSPGSDKHSIGLIANSV